MKNIIDNSRNPSRRQHIADSEKRQLIERIKRLGYNVVIQDPPTPGVDYVFTLRERGRFGLSTGRTYRGTADSESSLLELAVETAHRLAQGVSY